MTKGETMEINDMVMISIDDHAIEPADMFDRHAPAKYRDQMPKYIFTNDGTPERWEYQGQPIGMAGLNAVASWPREEWDFNPIGFKEMRPGTYDLKLRVKDMDANGVLASMQFPTFAGFNGAHLARADVDKDLTKIVIQSYNDWHIDEMVGEHPGRFVPLAIVPLWNPEAMAAEVRRVAKKGCHAITLPETPYGIDLPAYSDLDYWSPLWEACVENDVAACLHIGGAFGLLKRPPNGTMDDLVVLASLFSQVTCSDLMLSGTFKKFPDMKFALSEGGIGWISFFLDRIDRHMWNHSWTGLSITNDGITPTELWRKNFLGCFITDKSGLRNAHRIGIETIAWECDYPHSDTTWPFSPELLMEELAPHNFTDDEIDMITWKNAARFFNFDPFQHRTRAEASVGGLRAHAKDVDTSTTPKAEYRRRWAEAHA